MTKAEHVRLVTCRPPQQLALLRPAIALDHVIDAGAPFLCVETTGWRHIPLAIPPADIAHC